MSAGPAIPEPAADETRPGAAAADAAASFPELLRRFEVDGLPAALAYEQLRRRLIVYFRLHLPAEAEALADVTFDRIARKLREGEEVREIRHYAFGVARLVCLEAQARERRLREASADPLLQPQPAEEEEDEAELRAALAACLQQLGARSRELILAYYAGEGGETRRARKRLSTQWGVSLNALRNKALRIRETLEECVLRRLDPG